MAPFAHPSSGKKVKRKMTAVTEMLEKYKRKADLREQELEVRKMELELQQRKWLLEEEERRKRMELEAERMRLDAEERRAFIDLLRKQSS